LFYSPTFHAAVPHPGSVPQILTIHDVIHLEVTEEGSLLRTQYFQRVVRPAVLRAGLVFTVSEFSRSRITDVLKVPADFVVNVGNGCSDVFFEQAPPSLDDPPYVLFVGNGRVHKRVDLIAAAARLLPAEVMVKCVGVTAQDIGKFVLQPEELRRYDFYSGLTDAELRNLYSGARALAMPSSYEGFGLPAVEALASGTPVVHCCDAVEEIVGRHGVRVPPDGEALAAALERFIYGEPPARDDLRAMARRFTWDNVADSVEKALAARWPFVLQGLHDRMGE
jgi:glycosyltransferase involved in cell wall biosynthesis